ncbi:hypothetical protein [Yinghuangia sp. YIM S09857]|uniref:hypothetical protein n=1 Tax=Yinghuangia sp. YIM S09857 TaxID=3436929 RepID=UPI003F52D307
MYNVSTGAAAAGTGGALAATGAVSLMWAFVAAFTLLSAGLALKRIAPARNR